MDIAHLHLALTHLPVVGTLVGLGILVAGIGLRNDSVQTAALCVFIAAALVAVPTHITGERAEEAIEDLAGISEPVIDAHEDAALHSTIAVEILGLVSLAALVLGRRSIDRRRQFLMAALVLSLVTVGLMARTANSGGQIRHPEIRAAGTQGSGDDDD